MSAPVAASCRIGPAGRGSCRENGKRDSILGRYLRQYWKGTLVFGFFVGIFAFIFSLYNLEVEAVWYAAGLCALAALVILTVHFGRYRRRHLQRMRVLQDVPLLLDQLPEPGPWRRRTTRSCSAPAGISWMPI